MKIIMAHSGNLCNLCQHSLMHWTLCNKESSYSMCYIASLFFNMMTVSSFFTPFFHFFFTPFATDQLKCSHWLMKNLHAKSLLLYLLTYKMLLIEFESVTAWFYFWCNMFYRDHELLLAMDENVSNRFSYANKLKL